MENIITTEFSNRLKVEGVNYKGYGIIPKAIMLYPALSLESKAIYAYFCSFAGAGSGSFPARDKILEDLGMCKDSYYRHYKPLIEMGFLTVKQEKHIGNGVCFVRNIYTLVSDPPKLPAGFSEDAESQLRASGITSLGYGFIPKAVMCDSRLSVKAKGIYAYFCTFTASGNSAFPAKDEILFHLNLIESTYYRALKLLKKYNFVVIKQRQVDGRLTVNDYFLSAHPDMDSADKAAAHIIVADKPTKKQCSQKQYTQKQYTQKQDSNITKYINNIINNSIVTLSILDEPIFDDIQAEELEKKKENIKYEINKIGFLPEDYLKKSQKLRFAIFYLTEYAEFSQRSSWGDGDFSEFDFHAYQLFVYTLQELLLHSNKITGEIITPKMVYERLNYFTVAFPEFVSIQPLWDRVIYLFRKAVASSEIENYKAYFMKLVWDVLRQGRDQPFTEYHIDAQGQN